MTLRRIEAKLSEGRKRAADLARLEAETRQYAAERLGDARRLLLLAEVSDELDAATLGRLSLKEARKEVEDGKNKLSETGRNNGKRNRKYGEIERRQWLKIIEEEEIAGFPISKQGEIIALKIGNPKAARSITEYLREKKTGRAPGLAQEG